jgi:hypothetical protein
MKKRLSHSEFEAAIEGLDVGKQTLMIARAVLVEGKAQAEFVGELGLTKGAISQAVKRVWTAHQEKASSPEGYERVTALLPASKAFIVKKWAKETAEKLESEK